MQAQTMMLDDNISKLEGKLCKQKKTRMLKKQKQAQNFLLCSVVLFMLAVILMLAVIALISKQGPHPLLHIPFHSLQHNPFKAPHQSKNYLHTLQP